ncbi:MAG: 50S ribosomal protein L37ae [Desulfurococcales archaeon ex4484_204]|nr:MAG: 50S ribosomal protein L37ae [Desulfurococcales archaeon ex4484_204]RLG80714.1 MAG: 50S ribosomal protein L37ae [Thermoprotei archaeon]
MGRRTKSVGIAGRFGSRYGASLRKKWRKVMERRYLKYECPFCGVKVRMKRLSLGIWYCPSCGRVFAGGAYQPYTSIGRVAKTS